MILSRISVTNRGELGIFEGNYFLIVQEDLSRRDRGICPAGFFVILSRISVTNRGKLGIFLGNYSEFCDKLWQTRYFEWSSFLDKSIVQKRRGEFCDKSRCLF